jgi:hypothetical protein
VAVCDTCGQVFDERRYRIAIPSQRGSFHSVDCAVRAHRRLLARQQLVLAYGTVQAELMLR